MVGWQRCLRSVLRHAATMVEQNRGSCAFPYSTCSKPSPLLGQCKHLWRLSDLSTRRTTPFYQYLQHSGIFSSKNLLAEEDASMVPISSPLTPVMGDGGKTEKKTVASKPLRVQAVKKDIRQLHVDASETIKKWGWEYYTSLIKNSPKKVNLVAKLVRGMQVEDALLQLQVTIKRAAKTVYQVIHSARANAGHNHGLDPDRLIVDEAFVGKGVYLKRLSYHAKGRSGIMVRPKCRLTVVVREITPEEEAKIAKLRVSNFKKLTRQERQLVPHQLIETTPRWGRKRKEAGAA